ncbi:hypothetical protein ACH5RR_031875 [Cinchona calisaya]|uniref:Pectinesterase n=1 Tax=Cinchona calisaya TaxID=153742 RepID=A0ABD2YLS1_9GENT
MFQAVALSAQADNLTFYQCRFKGYQDTLNTAFGKQFFRECEVLGTIDFIFGDAAVVFQTCAILVRKPLPGQYLTITAQSRMTDGEKSGIIFQNCTVNATEHLRKSYDFKCYFGRPWNDYSRVVVLQSFIDSLIDPKGWIEWEGQIPVHPFCAEFNNRGPGANTSSRVTWSTMIISHKQASSFTVRRFLESGTWIPPNVPYYLDLL